MMTEQIDLTLAEIQAAAGLIDQGVRAVGSRVLDDPAAASLWQKLKVAAEQITKNENVRDQ